MEEKKIDLDELERGMRADIKEGHLDILPDAQIWLDGIGDSPLPPALKIFAISNIRTAKIRIEKNVAPDGTLKEQLVLIGRNISGQENNYILATRHLD